MTGPARHHLAARRLAAACLAVALSAPGEAGAARTRREPGKVSGGQFAPGRPAVPQYGPDPSQECLTSGVLDDVLGKLRASAKANGRPAPEVDGRVCAVAEAFLGWDSQRDGAARPRVLAFASQWFGLPAQTSQPTLAVFETEDARLLAERVHEGVLNEVMRAAHPRVGMATLRVRKGQTKVAFVVLDAPVELDPLPRRLDLGQKAKLSGRLLAGATDPIVQASDVMGQLAEPRQAAGESFEAELACGDRPGRILVEIRAAVGGRTAPVAAFPVVCGQELPATVAVASETWPGDLDAAERKILDLVNAERASVGLAPLQADAALTRVAREISQDLAARAGSPGGADVGERLMKEGIASQLVLQSAAADRTYERAHERLLASPSNRANLMNPEVTHAGVGAVTQNDAEGRPLVLVTEVFIKELPPVDVAKVRQQLRDAVAQKRKDARTNAVAPDATLDESAQRYAEALAAAGGTLPKEKQAELTAPLNAGFRSVTMVSGARPEPLDLAEEPQTTVAGKSLGVGVAQGRHPVLGRNAVYVVLMVGTPRGAAAEPAAAPAKKKPAAAPAKK